MKTLGDYIAIIEQNRTKITHDFGIKNRNTHGRFKKIIATTIWLRTLFYMFDGCGDFIQNIKGNLFIELHRLHHALFLT